MDNVLGLTVFQSTEGRAAAGRYELTRLSPCVQHNITSLPNGSSSDRADLRMINSRDNKEAVNYTE